MSQLEILEELKRMPVTERIALIETALQLIRQDLQKGEQRAVREERRKQLKAAARALQADYAADDELTAFTALDGEKFYA